jgi:hypothetical protein
MTKNAMRPRSVPSAACRLFGSFKAAIRAAGVLHLAGRYPRWSRATVAAAIRRRRDAGQPLNCLAVISDTPTLYDAARRYIGSWNGALRAAGVDPEHARAVRRPWTPKSVIRELRRRVAASEPVTCVSSIRPISLVRVCQQFFGSCEAAAIAAGVDPAKIGYHRSPRNGLRKPGGS